jgi:predicted dehydrogenase
MLDYCCYGAMFSYWVIGQMATAAVGLRGNLNSPFGDADDNGAMIVRFPQALGLFEGSWTTLDHGVPYGPIIYGTEGTLVMESDAEGNPAVREEHGGGDSTVHKPEPLAEGRHNVAYEYIHHLETGDPLHPTLEMMFNLDAMAILDAGMRAADSGMLEAVETAHWCVG